MIDGGSRLPPADALWTLASWLSPAYPVGAYTYSHGLEAAIAEGAVSDASTAAAWIADCLEHGAGRSDVILLAEAWRTAGQGRCGTDTAEHDPLAVLASALAASAERLLETEAQGAAFAQVVRDVDGISAGPAPYPVAVGRAAAAKGVRLPEIALFYLHAIASNLVSACVRLVPLGQTDGQRVLAGLAPLCLRVRDAALAAEIGDVGGCAILSDIASMRHEVQPVRLFRS